MSEPSTTAIIPRVKGVPLFGSLLALRGDRIRFFCDVAERYGDIALAGTTMGRAFSIVSSPDLCHAVLVEKASSFVKGPGLVFARPLLGNGLLTSEHAFHRRQRRMLAPTFAQKRIGEYGQVIVARTEAVAAALADGETIDASHTMMRLTLEIVGKTLFDAEVGSEAAEIGEAIERGMAYVINSMNSFVPLPPQLRARLFRGPREDFERLDTIIYRLIRARRAEGVDKGDLLSMLLAAQDEDDGTGMSDQQVRDEAMTLFLAGHETTANGLAWSLYRLAQHPELRERLESEVDTVLGGRPPTIADLPRLPFALQIFKETLRLYPPAFGTLRLAERDVTLGPYAFPAGSLVFVNIIGMHRRTALFPEPYRFAPDRFAPEAEKRLQRFSYIPFGGGPRICIGNHFALMEGQLALATLAQRVRLDLLPGWCRVEPEALMTLRPRNAIAMRVTRRAPAHRPEGMRAFLPAA
jgi:cytochrome P450